jgi:hypothetical protein
MGHVLHNHWKQWNCALGCGEVFDSAEEAKDHILGMHSSVSDPVTLVNLSESPKPADAVSFCPLCTEQVSSLKEYARHVGRHQKDLALFALPQLDSADDTENLERDHTPDCEASVDSDESSNDVRSPVLLPSCPDQRLSLLAAYADVKLLNCRK